jgi:hypothetical protein
MPEPVQAMLVLSTLMLGVGGMITMLLRARHLYGGGRRNGLFSRSETNESDVRLAALKSYETLSREKLDVLKRAIDMGWDDVQLRALDARLEQLVGKDEVGKIATGGLPSADLQSMVLSPAQELERIRKQGEQAG